MKKFMDVILPVGFFAIFTILIFWLIIVLSDTSDIVPIKVKVIRVNIDNSQFALSCSSILYEYNGKRYSKDINPSSDNKAKLICSGDSINIINHDGYLTIK